MDMVQRCNGVFKGGGAKGVAYVGALGACEQRGVQFEAVAGSSAGAITAVLVAAGLDAAEMRRLMPQALAAIQSPLRATFGIGRSSLLSNDRLRDWLDRLLIEQLALRGCVPAGGPRCTFDDLFAATEVGIYVVAMDLATRQPIVFSHELTPLMPIADAVVASSAIPVAFPPSLVEIDGEIHRLVDGGAYANYPSFVFDDPSFRAFHRLPTCEDVPTIGFVLDQDKVEERSTGHPRSTRTVPLATDRGSVERELGIFGAAIGSPLVRWSLVLLPMLFALVTALWLIAEAEHSFPVIGSLPGRFDALEDVGLLLLLLTVATVGVIGAVAAVALARLGSELLDGGIMGAVAAMGVGPNVPYWVGAAGTEQGRHIAVRLTVPRELTTLSFRAPTEVVERAIDAARDTTAHRLAVAFGAAPASGSTAESPWLPPDPGRAAGSDQVRSDAGSLDTSKDRRRGWRARLLPPQQRPTTSMWVSASIGLSSYFGFAFVGIAAYRGLADLVDGQLALGVIWLVGSGLGMLVGLIGLAARKHSVASTPFPILGRFSNTMILLAALLGVVLSAVLLAVGLNDERASISTVARTDSVAAVVKHIDETDDNIPLVWLEIAGDLSADDIGRLTQDLRGTTVTPCDQPDVQEDPGKRRRISTVAEAGPALDMERCLVFDTDETMGINPNANETVRYDLDTGLVFLEVQMWSIGYLAGPVIYLFGIVGLLALSYHSVRAVRWRASRSAES
jgi:NTE family protein